jgi:hypothetical protein
MGNRCGKEKQKIICKLTAKSTEKAKIRAFLLFLAQIGALGECLCHFFNQIFAKPLIFSSKCIII